MKDNADLLKKALSEQGDPQRSLDNDRLLAYLNGQLNPNEQHEVEQLLSEEGLESDALEGLKALGYQDAKQSTQKLNATLQTKLGRRKHKTKRAGNDPTVLIAIALILLLAVAGYAFLVYCRKGGV